MVVDILLTSFWTCWTGVDKR